MLELLNLRNQVKVIYLIFAKELDLAIRLIDVRIQKIGGTILDTNRNGSNRFLVTNKANQLRFFEKTLLMANISLKIVFEMFLLILNSANIDFLD